MQQDSADRPLVAGVINDLMKRGDLWPDQVDTVREAKGFVPHRCCRAGRQALRSHLACDKRSEPFADGRLLCRCLHLPGCRHIS